MLAAGVDDEALVVPGGIKRNDRIAYKSAVNYNGRYDRCKVGPRLPPPNPLGALWLLWFTRATDPRAHACRSASVALQDIMRITIQVTSLPMVLLMVQAMLASESITVVRMKDRFQPEFDSAPIGG